MPHGPRYKKTVVRNGNPGGKSGKSWSPTIRQLGVANDVAGGMTWHDAAVKNGYSTTGSAIHKLRHNPHMQEYLRETFEHYDIDAGTVVRVLKDAMTAEKVTRSHFKGVRTNTYNDVDHSTRLAAAKMTAELAGMFPKKGEQADAAAQTVNNILVIAREINLHDDSTIETMLQQAMTGAPIPTLRRIEPPPSPSDG